MSKKSKAPFGVWLRNHPLVTLTTIFSSIAGILSFVCTLVSPQHVKVDVLYHWNSANDSYLQATDLDSNHDQIATSETYSGFAANGDFIVSNDRANNNGGDSNSENNNGGGSNSGGNGNGTISNNENGNGTVSNNGNSQGVFSNSGNSSDSGSNAEAN
jgi:hypothetical protein